MSRKGNPGTQHPKFIAAQWKPGQSGNPKGRTPRKSLETIMKDILAERFTVEIEGGDEVSMTKLEALGRIIVEEMIEHRNIRAIEAYLERTWAKLQRHEHVGEGGGAIGVDVDVPDYEQPKLTGDEAKEVAAILEKSKALRLVNGDE